MTVPLPLLVTGIAGVAGYNAFHYFRAKHGAAVVGIRQADNWRLRGDGVVACNAEDRAGLARLFERNRFASVLDCAGNCALKSCELDPRMAWRVNVEGVESLLSLAAAPDVRIVHLSCDLVFSGASGAGGYVETDRPDPVTVYGATMVAAEERVLAARPDACVLRISLPMGPSFNGHAGAIDWIQSRFRAGRPATLYFDEVRTPTYTDCLNEAFERLLGGAEAGIFHGGAARRLSLYEIAQVVNRVGGYDPALLKGTPRREAGPMPPRAGNVALDSGKLRRALGRDPFDAWPLGEALLPAHRGWHGERPADEPRSPEWLREVLYRNPRRDGARAPEAASA